MTHIDPFSLHPTRPNRVASPPTATRSGLDFARHLEAALAETDATGAAVETGLTLADYRARPVALHPDLAGRPGSASPTERSSAAGYRPICPANRHAIEVHIQAAAQRYDLAPGLLRAVIRAESNFDPRAVSPAGARGLMQLMPATAEMLGVSDPFDIGQNIDGGAHYLRRMLNRFDGDPTLALAAYNAGPEAVARHGDTVPPFRETTAYVNRVLRFAEESA